MAAAAASEGGQVAGVTPKEEKVNLKIATFLGQASCVN